MKTLLLVGMLACGTVDDPPPARTLPQFPDAAECAARRDYYKARVKEIDFYVQNRNVARGFWDADSTNVWNEFDRQRRVWEQLEKIQSGRVLPSHLLKSLRELEGELGEHHYRHGIVPPPFRGTR